MGLARVTLPSLTSSASAASRSASSYSFATIFRVAATSLSWQSLAVLIIPLAICSRPSPRSIRSRRSGWFGVVRGMGCHFATSLSGKYDQNKGANSRLRVARNPSAAQRLVVLVVDVRHSVGIVHAARRAQFDPAHAQRIGITDTGGRGLIALRACQAYVKAIAH